MDSATEPHALLAREIKKLRDQGAEAIVLDLRGNGGGLLVEAVGVSSLFIENGEIVSVRGRHRAERTHDAQGDAILPKSVPVAVLVDGGSASASEIVTGACATAAAQRSSALGPSARVSCRRSSSSRTAACWT